MDKKQGDSERMERVRAAAERLAQLYPTWNNPRPPRSRAKWQALKMIEKKTGRQTGTIGNRVWVDDTDHTKGFYELDDAGNEVKWFPYPSKTD